MVGPNVVIRNALLLGTGQPSIFHTHPRQRDLSRDYDMAGRLIELGRMMELSLADHIIVAGGHCIPLRALSPEWFEG